MISMNFWMFYQQSKKESKFLKKEIVEVYKQMDEDFQENHYSKSSEGFCRSWHGSIRFMKCKACFDRN